MVDTPVAPETEWRPFPKQERFLALSCFEALFGGAAGPGKSQALIVGATRYIDRPRYRALLLRRTVPELRKSEGLIDRAEHIYRGLGAIGREQGKIWNFPGGARIELGSMEHIQDRFNYSSSEYQYIAFDELTSFEEIQYRFMVSRLRNEHVAPLQLRSATNPGGVGHDWVLRRFAPWLYPQWAEEYDGPRAEAGEVVYFRRRPGLSDDEEIVEPGTRGGRGRTFVPGFVSDNPIYAGSEYEQNLDALDPLTREQLKFGNWMARPGARVFFRREWFQVVDISDIPRGAFRVRYWDRAATADPRADWTVGLELAYAKPYWWIVDVVRGQWEPAQVEATIRRYAALDNARGVRTVLERDPAQAGKFEARYYLQELAGLDVHVAPPQGDKVTRAKPVSAQAQALATGQYGNIRLVRAPWNRALLDELEGFPEGHDDQVDALSGAFRQTLQHATSGTRSGGSRERASLPRHAGGY